MMIKKLVLLAVFGIFLSGSTALKAQSLVIHLKDGTLHEAHLGSLQKLSFSVSDLLVNFKNGTVDPYGLSTIRKLYFDTTSTVGYAESYENQSVILYPNPAMETITITGMTEGVGTILIIRPDGKLMYNEVTSSGNMTINVSGLKRGLYFLNAKGHTSKFVKL